jgi:caa(3)-type oxidase subunit IV
MTRKASPRSLTIYIALATLQGGSIFLLRLPLDPWRIALILLLAAIQGWLLIFNFMRVRLHGPLIYVTAGASFVWLGILFILSFSDYLSRQVVW